MITTITDFITESNSPIRYKNMLINIISEYELRLEEIESIDDLIEYKTHESEISNYLAIIKYSKLLLEELNMLGISRETT